MKPHILICICGFGLLSATSVQAEPTVCQKAAKALLAKHPAAALPNRLGAIGNYQLCTLADLSYAPPILTVFATLNGKPALSLTPSQWENWNTIIAGAKENLSDAKSYSAFAAKILQVFAPTHTAKYLVAASDLPSDATTTLPTQWTVKRGAAGGLMRFYSVNAIGHLIYWEAEVTSQGFIKRLTQKPLDER